VAGRTDRPDMTTNEVAQVATGRAVSPWAYAGMEEILPGGLPVGGLTLIRLRGGAGGSLWSSAVARLVLGSVSAGRPVAYVSVGGNEAGERMLQEQAASPRLAIIRDEDVSFTAPMRVRNVLGDRDWVDVAKRFSCAVPTLHSIDAQLQSHELEFGPSLLVLDQFEYARPYWQASTDEADQTLPGGLRLTADQANLWRAQDLYEAAVARPAAPTIAVWHEYDIDGAIAFRALQQAALTVIDCMRMEVGRVLVTVTQRETLQSDLPYQSGHMRIVADEAGRTVRAPDSW
jgi:hypothetical protein